MMFTHGDARWLSDTVRNIYAAERAADFASLAMQAVDERFRLFASGCEEVAGGGSIHIAHGLRCSVAPPRDYAAFFHDQPFRRLIGRPAAGRLLHLRKEVTQSTWAKTDHFNGIARPMGWNDQILIVAQAEPSFVAVTLYRDSKFTPRERELLMLLCPHLDSAWRRVRPPSSRDDCGGRSHFELSPNLRPRDLTASDRALLRAYFPSWRQGAELPNELAAWVRESLRRLHKASEAPPLDTLIVESARGSLFVRCFPGKHPDVGARLVLMEALRSASFLQLRRRGLTSRQCEVLHWAAMGKRDAEIALIVGCAPKTVSKHIEAILAKLGAETRLGAAQIAREWLSGQAAG